MSPARQKTLITMCSLHECELATSKGNSPHRREGRIPARLLIQTTQPPSSVATAARHQSPTLPTDTLGKCKARRLDGGGGGRTALRKSCAPRKAPPAARRPPGLGPNSGSAGVPLAASPPITSAAEAAGAGAAAAAAAAAAAEQLQRGAHAGTHAQKHTRTHELSSAEWSGVEQSRLEQPLPAARPVEQRILGSGSSGGSVCSSCWWCFLMQLLLLMAVVLLLVVQLGELLLLLVLLVPSHVSGLGPVQAGLVYTLAKIGGTFGTVQVTR